MTQADAYRQLVVARAGGACEYCRLLEAATGVTFHIEHVLPRSCGGGTAMSNLALICPGCNLAKADRAKNKDQSGILTHAVSNAQLLAQGNQRSPPYHRGWHHPKLSTASS